MGEAGRQAAGMIRVLRAEDRAAAPWRNGGGVTREVAASVPDTVGGFADRDAFDWRVSLADVAQEGPFSSFPGVDRVITVVDGPGMVLTVDGQEHRIDQRFRPFSFRGDSRTDCRLLGKALVDLNVMTRRGRCTARVDIVEDGIAVLDCAAGTDAVAVVLSGSAVLRGSGARLDGLDAIHARAERAELDVFGTTAVVTFGDVAALATGWIGE
jgi:hypothetical protein